MVSVTQRIAQYNRTVGQPRGGLVKPSSMTVASVRDEHGQLDHTVENLHPSVVGTATDYLVRLARIRTSEADILYAVRNVFHVSLRGAARIDAVHAAPGVTEAAAKALGSLAFDEDAQGSAVVVIDENTVRVACQLAGYDVGARNDPSLWNPGHGAEGPIPSETTVAHITIMLARTQTFFEAYGPVTKDGFIFTAPELVLQGDRGGYTNLVDSGDGDFLTADTLWDMKISANKPTKDHTLQLLMYFLMGKASGLPEFEQLTHVGLINPRLGAVHRLAVADVPADVIDVIRRDVIGYEMRAFGLERH